MQTRDYWRNRYHELKARGKCVDCAKRAADTGVRCPACTQIHNTKTARWSQRGKQALKNENEKLARTLGVVLGLFEMHGTENYFVELEGKNAPEDWFQIPVRQNHILRHANKLMEERLLAEAKKATKDAPDV